MTVQPLPTRPSAARPGRGLLHSGTSAALCPATPPATRPHLPSPPTPRPGGALRLHKGDSGEQEHRRKGLGPRPGDLQGSELGSAPAWPSGGGVSHRLPDTSITPSPRATPSSQPATATISTSVTTFPTSRHPPRAQAMSPQPRRHHRCPDSHHATRHGTGEGHRAAVALSSQPPSPAAPSSSPGAGASTASQRRVEARVSGPRPVRGQPGPAPSSCTPAGAGPTAPGPKLCPPPTPGRNAADGTFEAGWVGFCCLFIFSLFASDSCFSL